MGEYTSGSFRARVHNEKEVTPEFVLNESKQIWAKVRHEIKVRKLVLGDTEGAAKLMEEIRKEHKDFCQAYPIVVRYMVEMQIFHPTAMARYLRKIAHHPWTSVEAYLDAQADYVAQLYMATHKRWKSSDVHNVRANIRAILQREHEQFKLYQKESEAEVEYIENRSTKEAREDLIKVLEKLGGKAPTTCELSGASDPYNVWEPTKEDDGPAEEPPVPLPFEV